MYRAGNSIDGLAWWRCCQWQANAQFVAVLMLVSNPVVSSSVLQAGPSTDALCPVLVSCPDNEALL